MIARTIDEVVPVEDRIVSAEDLMSATLLVDELKFRGPGGRGRRARRAGPQSLFGSVPTADLVRMVWRLVLSQMPHHDPAVQPLPEWADTWMAEYARGTDMTAFWRARTGGSLIVSVGGCVLYRCFSDVKHRENARTSLVDRERGFGRENKYAVQQCC